MNMLGFYQRGDSVLHCISPSSLVTSYFILLIAVVMLSSSLPGIVLSIHLIIILCSYGGIALLPAVRALWRFRAFMITIFLMNAFFQPAAEPLFSWWIITLSSDGMMIGLRMIATIVLVTLLSSLLTAVATPLKITDGLRALLHPFSYLHLRTDEIALIISIAITMIPVLAREGRYIMLSSRSRGFAVHGNKIKERVLSFVPLVLPLFLSAFRKADDLTSAMEARGYRGEYGRKRKKVHYAKADVLSIILSILVFAGAAALGGVY